jgi:uncharacterized membrane protein YgcG
LTLSFNAIADDAASIDDFSGAATYSEPISPTAPIASSAAKDAAKEAARAAGVPVLRADGTIDPAALFGGGDVGTPFVNALAEINKVIFSTIGTAAMQAGTALLAVFVGVYFGLFGIRFKYIQSFSSMIGDVVEFLFKVAIPLVIITYNSAFNEWFQGGAYYFASKFMGVDSEVFPFSALIASPVNNFSSMMGSGLLLVHNIPFTAGSGTDVLTNFSFTNFIYAVLVLIITVALGAIYFIATLMVVAQMMAALVVLPVALALAPLLSVFVIGWMFSGIFTAWLSFLMLGFFAMLIGGAFVGVFTIFSTMLSVDKFKIVGFQAATNDAVPQVEIIWLNVAAILLYSMVLFFLSRQVWAIASQLSGNFKLNTGTFGDHGGRGNGNSGIGGGGGGGGSKGSQAGVGSVTQQVNSAFKSPVSAMSAPFTASSAALKASSPTLSSFASGVAGAVEVGAIGTAGVVRDTIKSGGSNVKDYFNNGVAEPIKNAGQKIASIPSSVANKTNNAKQAGQAWWNSGKY